MNSDLKAALKARAKADREIGAALKALPAGTERRLGYRAARTAGLTAIEIAGLVGVSRNYVYQVLND